jgi:hypothetical protein
MMQSAPTASRAAVNHAFDVNRAVHRQINAVERRRGFETRQKIGLEVLIGRSRDRPSRHGTCIEGRQVGCSKGFQHIEIRLRQHFIAAPDDEILLRQLDRIVGAAFDMQAADSNTHRSHSSITPPNRALQSSKRFRLPINSQYDQSQR